MVEQQPAEPNAMPVKELMSEGMEMPGTQLDASGPLVKRVQSLPFSFMGGPEG